MEVLGEFMMNVQPAGPLHFFIGDSETETAEYADELWEPMQDMEELLEELDKRGEDMEPRSELANFEHHRLQFYKPF